MSQSAGDESSRPEAFTDEGWPLQAHAYEPVEEIGQGAFAKVLKAWCPDKQQFVAVKIMALENITTSMEEIQMEVRAMKMNRHENVLDLFACFVVSSDLWLVMPMMDKGSCYHALRSLRKSGRIQEGEGLPEECIATIMRELLQGLEYIHGQGQIHRDIKAGNILLNSEGRVAIADFGVAGWFTEAGVRGERERKTFVGTPCWMAPEVMEQTAGYNEKADIWSVGITGACARECPRVPRRPSSPPVPPPTALELAKGYAPYAKYAPMQVLVKTIREPAPSFKSYPEVPGAPGQSFSEKASKFVARCLQKDPRARPSAHELLTDPFVKKGIKNAKLVEALLSQVPTVGAAGAPAAAIDAPSGRADVALVPGTTWVFPDELKAQLGIGQYAGGGGGDEAGGAASAPGGPLSASRFGDEGDEEETSMDAVRAPPCARVR
jgi:serine/threonine-protein kinase OSR1/STK39